ncbi:MAG: prolyl oligopeptidase family serine peptidase [Caulobacteraceae bacterium]|nr:prolyl oligopeptidase family serine peptidase [Caulobacteraceae bacterium]
MRRLPVALALAASLVGICPASAQTHRFGVEDLIGREGVGQVRASPDGRWVVVERQAAHDQAATYRFQTTTYALLTELEIHAADGLSPTRRFAAAGHDVGYLAGPFSPSGTRMVVLKVTEATYRMGILTLATGDVQWLPITPEQIQFGRSIAWRSETDVAVIARPLDDFPIQMRVGFQTQDRVERLWRNAASGHASSSVYIPSGRNRDARAQAVPSSLILVNAETGSQRVLAQGEWFDLALSPDGRRLAALRNAEDIQPTPGRPLLVGDPIRRRRLAVIDLDSGAVADPLPEEDLAMYLMSWSPDSSRLLAFGRPSGSADFDEAGRYWLIGRDGTAKRLDTGPDRPWLQRTWDGVAIPLASWDGVRPLIQVGEDDRNRHWRRDDGERFLVKEPGERIARLQGRTVVQRHDGLYDLDGAKIAPGRLMDLGQMSDGANPAQWNPSALLLGQGSVVDGACIRTLPTATPICVSSITGDERAVAVSPAGVVTTGLDERGVTTVRLHALDEVQTLTTVNAAWRDVAWGRVEPVAHLGPEGQALRSWLLLPAGMAAGERPPVVVQIYPGRALSAPPATILPGSRNPQNNPSVIAGAGYAVLIASLPHPASGPTMEDLADRIFAIVDEAGRLGLIDPNRVAVMGHSYGAYSSLRAATQSDRFKAVIATSGYPELTRSMELPPFFRVAPDEGVPVGQMAGWGETGQGAFGAFSTSPENYVAQSPLFSVERLRSPTLLAEGDQENARMGALFSALYRLNREAALVTYYGEGHVYESPGNVRDLHARILDWLGRYLGPPARLDPLGPMPHPNLEHPEQQGSVGARAP